MTKDKVYKVDRCASCIFKIEDSPYTEYCKHPENDFIRYFSAAEIEIIGPGDAGTFPDWCPLKKHSITIVLEKVS